LYTVLEEQGFNPTDFQIVTAPENNISGAAGEGVMLKGTKHFFSVYRNPSDYSGTRFIAIFSPGKEEMQEWQECYEWMSVSMAFGTYLSFLRREMEAVDPWASAEKFSKKVQTLPSVADENAPITASERTKIQGTLDEIRQTLLEHVGQSEKKQTYVKEQFAVLHDAIGKFGKKDYLMLVYTTVIGVATTVGVSPDLGSQIIGLLNSLLSHLPKMLA
jgi:hypothetical protein